VVQAAGERAGAARVQRASAADTAPPLEAHTIVHRPGSQAKPCDFASARGWPVRTAAT
jgi:hypothetical protein